MHPEQPATCHFQQTPGRQTSPQVSVCVTRALPTLFTAVSYDDCTLKVYEDERMLVA